jgi:hypothetical protein
VLLTPTVLGVLQPASAHELTVITVERSCDDVEGAIDPTSEKRRRRVPIATPLRLLPLEHKVRTGRRGCEFVFGSKLTQPFTSTNVRKRALRCRCRRNALTSRETGAYGRDVSRRRLAH